jgi:glycosyltransferase involved in cell wall biosynthesis
VTRRFHDARLIIVGDDPTPGARYLLELQRYAEQLRVAGKVRFVSYRPDVSAVLGGLDIFALPSHREGLPLALLEAMAAGKPIIATSVGGIPEAIESEKEGILVRPGQIEPLASALRRVSGDPTLAASLGRSARRRYEAEFTARQMENRILTLYESGVNHLGQHHTRKVAAPLA